MVSNEQKFGPASVTASKDGKIKKSRNRVPTSCSVCRRRKMKCDRAKPYCGSCVANDTVSSCSYNQQPWEYLSSEKQLSNEVLRLKMKINELERVIHQHQIVSPPDSLLPNSSADTPNDDDPFIELGARFDKLVIKENKLVHYGTTSYLGLQANDPVLLSMYYKYFQKHAERYHDEQKKKKAQNIVEQKKEEDNDYNCWAEKGTGTNSLIPTGPDVRGGAKLSDFTDPINKLLPSYENIILLVEHFFKKAYPLFPFVDKDMFTKDLKLVLKETEDGGAAFSIQQGSQLTVVALAVILMRISFLVLPLSDYYVDPDRIKDFDIAKLCASELNISPIFVEHAKDCVFNSPGNDNMLRKISLANIQVLLYLKLYRTWAPEDGDETADSSVSLAILIQMCRMHGLHRDPEQFRDVVRDDKVRHLWRKLWYKLLELDVVQAVQFGAPLIVNDDQWDCKLPSLSVSDQAYLEAYKDDLLKKRSSATKLLVEPFDAEKYERLYCEKMVVEAAEMEYKGTCLLREVVQLCHNMKVTPRKSDFASMIKRIESESSFVMESFQEILWDPKNSNIHHQVFNIKKCSLRRSMLMMRYILSYILLLSSEDENDINEHFNNLYGDDNEYLVKTAESALTLFKNSYDFLIFETEDELSCSDIKTYKQMKQFYSPYDKLLASEIFVTSQRSLQFLTSVTLRYTLNFFSFTSLVKSFCNSQDSIDVLNWFNINIHNLSTNVDVSLDKQFSIMLFQYIKVYYSKCLLLKDKFFHCLRANMLLKIFINHLRLHYPQSYEELNDQYSFSAMDEEKEGVQSNLEAIESARNVNLDTEDIYMKDFDFANEDDFLNSLLNDPVLALHSFPSDHKDHHLPSWAPNIAGFNPDSTGMRQSTSSSLLTTSRTSVSTDSPDEIHTGDSTKFGQVQNIFSPSEMLSNEILSPYSANNELYQLKVGNENTQI